MENTNEITFFCDETRVVERATKETDLLDNYGLQHQSYKAIEEMCELGQALLKWWDDKPENDTVTMLNLRDNVIDELADVSIMVDQLVYGFGATEEVLKRMDYKLDRQLSRINLQKTKGMRRDDPWEDDGK